MLRPALSADPSTGTEIFQDGDGVSFMHTIGALEPVHWAALTSRERKFEECLDKRLARDRAALWASLQELKLHNFFADHADDLAVSQRFVEAHLTAVARVQKAEADRWLREAKERLEKSDDAVNRVLVRRERKVFAERGLLRGRRR